MTEGSETRDRSEALIGRPQRLHVLTIPLRLIQQGGGLAIGLVVATGSGFEAITDLTGGALVTVAILAVIPVLFVGYQLAYYRRYEYELTEDTFDISSGVFSRREREIPYGRIQNVDISQNVLQRVFGLAQIQLETAGGMETEAQLQFVGKDRAREIQQAVSQLSRGEEDRAGDGTETEQFESVFEITERELGVLAVTSTDFRLVSLIFLASSIVGPSALSMTEERQWWMYLDPEGAARLLFGPLAGIATVIVLGLISGVIYATRFYGFSLRRGADELRYERGLLQKFSGTIPIPKIQSLTIEENVLARALGYASLSIETAGGGGGSRSNDGNNTTTQAAIPVAERPRVLELTNSLESVGDFEFDRPPKRARERYAARYAGMIAVLVAGLFVVDQVTEFALYWYSSIALFALVPPAAHYKWKHRGYHLGDDHVVTRNGFWVRKIKIVPYHRVQTVFSTETVFQRRRTIGTVTVDTASAGGLSSSDPKAVDVAGETADRLRETVADRLYESLARRRRERRSARSPRDESDRGHGDGSDRGPGDGSDRGPGDGSDRSPESRSAGQREHSSGGAGD